LWGEQASGEMENAVGWRGRGYCLAAAYVAQGTEYMGAVLM
jgi:hypothetical protein